MLVFAWPDRAPREGPQKLEFYVDKLNGITLRRVLGITVSFMFSAPPFNIFKN